MKNLALAFALFFVTVTSVYASFGSCTFQNENSCLEYVGKFWGDYTDQMPEACREQGGVFSKSDCSKNSRVGKCILEKGTDMVYYIFFYKPYNSDSAKEACDGMGGEYQKN